MTKRRCRLRENPVSNASGSLSNSLTRRRRSGAVARTSTLALNNVTLPFVLALADKGYKAALEADPNLRDGLNVYRGRLTYEAVASALGETYIAAADALAA